MKKMPGWLIGGLLGLLWFVLTFGYGYLTSDIPGTFGMVPAVLNIPGLMLASFSFFPQTTFVQFAMIIITDAAIGALIGLICSKLFGRKSPSY